MFHIMCSVQVTGMQRIASVTSDINPSSTMCDWTSVEGNGSVHTRVFHKNMFWMREKKWLNSQHALQVFGGWFE